MRTKFKRVLVAKVTENTEYYWCTDGSTNYANCANLGK